MPGETEQWPGGQYVKRLKDSAKKIKKKKKKEKTVRTNKQI